MSILAASRLGYTPPGNAREAAYNKGVDDAVGVIRATVVQLHAEHRRILDTHGDFCSCGFNFYPCPAAEVLFRVGGDE